VGMLGRVSIRMGGDGGRAFFIFHSKSI